ncbi:MAG: hypothetical protein WAU61_02110 [Smithella sp.]
MNIIRNKFGRIIEAVYKKNLMLASMKVLPQKAKQTLRKFIKHPETALYTRKTIGDIIWRGIC